MSWEVVYTERAADWIVALGEADFQRPGLGRPLPDTIEGSRHRNMKELRTGTVRALFAFDPHRRAVMLLGGDKRGDWSSWYERNIPLADDLYDAYLREET